MKKIIATLLVFALALPNFVFGGGGHNHGAIKAAHGGRILEVGAEAAHLEYVHDAKSGKITIYVLDGEGKNAMGLGDAIRINVSATKNTKKTQVVTRALNLKAGTASTFDAESAALKNAHLEGTLSLKIGGKKYSVEIPHDHGHHGHDH